MFWLDRLSMVHMRCFKTVYPVCGFIVFSSPPFSLKHTNTHIPLIYFSQIFVYFFFLFTAAPMAYGSSQARGRIGASAADLCSRFINARSLTHWARPGIKPSSSQILCWVLNSLSHNGNSFCAYVKEHEFSYAVSSLSVVYLYFGQESAVKNFWQSIFWAPPSSQV